MAGCRSTPIPCLLPASVIRGSPPHRRYHLTPVNFSRVVKLNGEDLSVEQELRQLTGPLHSFVFPSAVSPWELSDEWIDDVRRRVALQQYGSIVYDRVTGGFRCWNQHLLEGRPMSSYKEAVGISCDFCGWTAWSRSSSGTSPRTSQSLTTAGTPGSGAEDSFYHCSSCDMDVCLLCCEEARSSERFQLPCLQCTQCGHFIALEEGNRHECTPVQLEPEVSPVSPKTPQKRQRSLRSPESSCWRVRVKKSATREMAGLVQLVESSPETTMEHRSGTLLVFTTPALALAENIGTQAQEMGHRCNITKIE